MIAMRQTGDYEQLFGLQPEHSLKLTSRHRVVRNNTLHETRWLDEHDCNQRLVARYRTWTNQLQRPPYRRQIGWERYSLSGEMLDREVRYSKRADEEYLH